MAPTDIRQEKVRRNLRLLRSCSRGGMRNCLMNESIGGNAGKIGRFSCYAANFHYDTVSGDIRYFGNYQEVPQQYRILPCGTFKLAIVGLFDLIVEVYHAPESREADKTLEDTVHTYNGHNLRTKARFNEDEILEFKTAVRFIQERKIEDDLTKMGYKDVKRIG